ncbi:MAG: hypothetical protein ACK5O2_04835 [Microthrixaceae bacterium]
MRAALATTAVSVVFTIATLVAPTTSVAVGAQEDPGTTTPATSTPTTSTPVTSTPPQTTSTLPSGGDLGNILPRPNSGREPQTAGDPGGWQQVALFFALCFVVIAMAGGLWWRSHVLRARREAAGHDPVKVAEAHGGDVRAPRPPGIID